MSRLVIQSLLLVLLLQSILAYRYAKREALRGRYESLREPLVAWDNRDARLDKRNADNRAWIYDDERLDKRNADNRAWIYDDERLDKRNADYRGFGYDDELLSEREAFVPKKRVSWNIKKRSMEKSSLVPSGFWVDHDERVA
ncbi:uncharacterized protein LOC114331687 [Diabrotica virgifera virgifera]|uniref:Uncharacterized protein n=1 Tax=Diabrotica virgifera virgifera TaxID=50390 RepID=A0ABM5INA1_DIAVI|nr:uncharacterized protein LOC114331687 [Diabrotica virgifera virgifera]